MNPGKLNKKISIVSQTAVQDVYGGASDVWSDAFATWGTMRPIVGRELYQLHQVHGEVSYEFTIRHRVGVLSKMRVKHDSRTFEIVSVINIKEENKIIKLLCKELI